MNATTDPSTLAKAAQAAELRNALLQSLTEPSPWLIPYASIARAVAAADPALTVADALNATSQASPLVRFVDQSALASGEAYESFIARTACVPTRDNLHDSFNGLTWLAYPHTKRRLNQLQAHEVALHGIDGTRGAVRDALTLLDENGALLRAPSVLIEALRARDWRSLFIEHRSHWRSAGVVVFGHALLEKLMQPRKALTAHVWVVEDLEDEALAAKLRPEILVPKPFLPMPILGVPGWWSANDDPRFYDDPDVFRRPR